MNTTPTSFSPFGPAVSGTTTSLPTVGGVYDGSLGEDTLTFKFRQNATVGSGDKLEVEVRDGTNQKLETLDFRGLAPGTPVSLASGLTLSLGAGSVSKNDTFTVSVSASVGSRVDPDKPFDGTRNDDPNFEPGLGVTAGSFEVNGVTISVAADDTLNAVLARITASGAGVTASFDEATETVVLTRKTPGASPTITLGNDTSGFLAATKLAGAVVSPGQDADHLLTDPIRDVPALAAVSSGTFQVNGVALTVDVAVDSLTDVLARIDASAAGVRASYDPVASRVVIESEDPEASLVLSDGNTGLFTALAITPATYQPDPAAAGAGRRIRGGEAFRDDLRRLGRALASVFDPDRAGLSPYAEVAGRLREAITGSFEATLEDFDLDEDEDPGALRSGLGIDFDFRRSPGPLELDLERLAEAERSAFDRLHRLLFAERPRGRDDGLVGALLEAVSEIQGELSGGTLGGALIDLRV